LTNGRYSDAFTFSIFSPYRNVSQQLPPRRFGFALQTLVSLSLLLTSAVYGLTVGAFDASPMDVLKALMGTHSDLAFTQAIQQLRLPRVLGALLIGASLALAGTSFQALFRNPLVSPDILAVSSGAALGCVAAITLKLDAATIQLAAFLGGLMAVALVLGLASVLRFPSTLTLLLSGVVLSALFAALVSLMQMLADTQSTLPGIVFWLLGSLSNLTKIDILWLFISYLAGFGLIYRQHRSLDKLALGDITAQTLGVNVRRTRWLCILGATLVTATTVAVAGMIGWIGLVVPHITRLLVGANVRTNLIIGSLLSATLLCFIDALSRSLFSIEIPIGIATAIVGVPLFIGTVLRSSGEQG
jgi:iron complex transport system permease protein